MKQRREGGNAWVDFEGDRAIKKLKEGVSTEAQKRFLKESEALLKIKEVEITNVAEIHEVRDDSIIMRAYDDNLDALLHLTRGNPTLAVKLLLPIVISLNKLSQINPPIYHRDIKPTNIFYLQDCESGEYQLYLGDFGCCYFISENEPRITEDQRPVGAREYRAPEYDYSRVDNVTEKGDIYSIGKLLWAMINGVKREVFPYTLWYPKPYNLNTRFPHSNLINRANLIISTCVASDPEERPAYDQLIGMLEQMDEIPLNEDEAKIMEKNARIASKKIIEEQEKEKTITLIKMFREDIFQAIKTLRNNYPEDSMLLTLEKNFASFYDQEDLMQIADTSGTISFIQSFYMTIDLSQQ